MSSISVYPPLSFTLTQRWRNALPAVLILIAWVHILYRDAATAMVLVWSRSDTFAHGFLVPPIVLWLIWRQRRVIEKQTPQASLVTFFFVTGAAVVWLLGELAAVNVLTQLAFVALLVSIVPAVLGRAVTRLLFFPLGFLFFAVPIGEFLLPQLMEWTANFTVLALRLSGIPVYREGLNFVIPSGNWSVVEACSGVRYLIASLTVGTLFAYLNYRSIKRRILFVIVSIVVPVVANWMRAYMIVMLGHLSDNKLAVGVDHLIYGWVFFGVVIILMFLIGARWAEPEKVEIVTNRWAETHENGVAIKKLWASTACFALLVGLPHAVLWAIERDKGIEPVLLTAPAELGAGWQVIHPGMADFKPGFKNPSAEVNESYTNKGRTVGLYLGYYRHQDYGRKLVSSSNVLVGSNDPQWSRVASGTHAAAIGEQVVSVLTEELRGSVQNELVKADRLVVWQVYWLGGIATANPYLATAFGAFNQLMGRGDDAAVIVVYTLKDQAGGAEEVLQSFLSANYSVIDALMTRERSNR